MPSPFPGMDPYLEHPAIFPDLHDRLINFLSESLQVKLPEPYFSVIGTRLWVEVSHRPINPDVHVLRGDGAAAGDQTSNGEGGVATATATRPVLVQVPELVTHDESREPFLEIRTLLDEQERLVTTIEILSLTNKTPGEHGRDLYRKKQREVLDSDVHLVEIDLLRGGQHTTAVPRAEAIARAGPFDYHVCTRLFDRPGEYLVYPFRLPDRLPEIAIPLLPGERPVVIDLQAVFDRGYDAGPYRRRIRYAKMSPEPPLNPEQLAWVKQVLTQKGLLPDEEKS